MREHNLALLAQLTTALAPYVVSPVAATKCSGTAIINFAKQQAAVLAALTAADISVDVRAYGIRISPHIYNDSRDIEWLIKVVKQVL